MSAVGAICLGFVMGSAAIILFWEFVIRPREEETFDQTVAHFEGELELARNEAKVYRNLLFPVLNRAEAPGAGAENPLATTNLPPRVNRTPTKPAPTQAASATPGRKRPDLRLPFRLRFNQARKATNTPQMKVDALAEALMQQKVPTQEKTDHV